MKIDFKTKMIGPKGIAFQTETIEKNEKGENILRDLLLEDVILPLLINPTEMNQKAALDIKRQFYKLYNQIESSEDKVIEVSKSILDLILERLTEEKSQWSLYIQMKIDEIFNKEVPA